MIFDSKSLLKDRDSQLKDMENLSYTQNTTELACEFRNKMSRLKHTTAQLIVLWFPMLFLWVS